MKIFDKLLGGGTEHDVFIKSKRIIEHAAAANKILIRIINGENGLETIHGIEAASDRDVFEISNSITSGAIAPNLIDDMIRFANKEDEIVDLIFNLSRAIVRYRKTKNEMDNFTRTNLLALASLSSSALSLLSEMLSVDTILDAGKLRARMEIIEKEGDGLKDALLDYAYMNAQDFRSFYYTQNVAYLADDILDECEDTSDMIVKIMRSIIT